MIKVIHSLLSIDIVLDSQHLNVLVIENPNMLVSFVEEINFALEGISEEISIVENNQKLKDNSKIFFATDIFNLDFNNKRIQNAIFKKLCFELLKQEYPLNQVICETISILEQAITNIDSPISFNPEIDINAFLKCFSPMIDNEYDLLVEKLVNFINVLVEFTNLKVIIFLNLQCFLSESHIENLLKHCKYKDVALFLIESSHQYKFKDEKCIIIDKDLCEIF